MNIYQEYKCPDCNYGWDALELPACPECLKRVPAPKTVPSTLCPFCGSLELHLDYNSAQNGHWVFCGNCMANGPVMGTWEESIEMWEYRSLATHL